MKRNTMFPKLIPFLLGICAVFNAEAKVWRVNNNPGISTDFADMSAALSSPSVVNNDTIYVEGSATPYSGFTLNKKLVIIGTGYFLSGAGANTGLQANPNSSRFNFNYIVFDSTASGSTLIGLDNFYMGVGPNLGSATDNITITRCQLYGLGAYYSYVANTAMVGWKINKCYITSTNNLVRNNVFRSSISLYNGYFANNIITGNALRTVCAENSLS